MKVTVQTLSPVIRKLMDWEENATGEIYEFEGETIADLFKVVRDCEGKSFLDRFHENDGVISTSYIYIDSMYFLREEDLRRKLKDGQTIVLLGRLILLGGG